jgi:hypothetical protein
VDATVVLVNVAGWVGMVLLLGAFALVTRGSLEGTSRVYQLMNLVGAALLILNSGYYRAWPSAVLNVVWVGIGVFGLVRSRRVQHAGELLDPVDEPRSGTGPHAVGVDGVDPDAVR